MVVRWISATPVVSRAHDHRGTVFPARTGVFGPLSWFGGEYDEEGFLQHMTDENRLVYEFDINRAYGIG
jgi:hypothetical protein